ncbi:hypothetical protein [Tsukamurella tyrosinosolvens]|uniref:hypothetical protein n=1 Tax=Tsukamurella tyrosinosolvens TaxID=57704 RepID=UPI0015F19487|nr:hypothetical protein [Tsukamurella tyrosinosolvens]
MHVLGRVSGSSALVLALGEQRFLLAAVYSRDLSPEDHTRLVEEGSDIECVLTVELAAREHAQLAAPSDKVWVGVLVGSARPSEVHDQSLHA